MERTSVILKFSNASPGLFFQLKEFLLWSRTVSLRKVSMQNLCTLYCWQNNPLLSFMFFEARWRNFWPVYRKIKMTILLFGAQCILGTRIVTKLTKDQFFDPKDGNSYQILLAFIFIYPTISLIFLWEYNNDISPLLKNLPGNYSFNIIISSKIYLLRLQSKCWATIWAEPV